MWPWQAGCGPDAHDSYCSNTFLNGKSGPWPGGANDSKISGEIDFGY